MKVEIPLNYLKAARLFTAKEDVRFYLKGVALKDGHVAGATGAYVGAIRCPALDGLPEIIIPNQPLDFFLKKAAGYRSIIELPVTVEWDDERKGTLSIGSDVEHFAGIDGTFPDFKRVIPSHTAPTGHPQFNWDLFQPFQKAAVALGTKATDAAKALLIPGGDNSTARVVLVGHPEFSGAIVPLHPNTYAASLAFTAEQEGFV